MTKATVAHAPLASLLCPYDLAGMILAGKIADVTPYANLEIGACYYIVHAMVDFIEAQCETVEASFYSVRSIRDLARLVARYKRACDDLECFPTIMSDDAELTIREVRNEVSDWAEKTETAGYQSSAYRSFVRNVDSILGDRQGF